MELIQGLMVFGGGIFAGFINVLAGGGSLITIPLLILFGLPTAVANGSNRIALVAGGLAGVHRFSKKGVFDWRVGLKMGIPAIIGAIAGSFVAVDLPDSIFKPMLAVLMLVILIFILKKPKIYTHENSKNHPYWITALVFLGIGLYGGIIQAGVGFLLMGSLAFLTNFNLVKINSLKLFVVSLYLIFSLVIFVSRGKVNWSYGLVLSAGNICGAWIGTHVALTKGDKWIKIVLSSTVIVMSLKLIGLF